MEWSANKGAAILSLNAISPRTQTHLLKVYSMLAVSMMSAAFGTWFAISYKLSTLLLVLHAVASFVLLAIASRTRTSPTKLMVASMIGWAFLSGHWIAPLVQYAINLNPEIVFTAFGASAVIFLAFSASALLSPRRSFLYIGGMLGSMLSYLLLMRFLSMFSTTLSAVYEVYLGLFIFSGWVIFDTQLIVEQAEMGEQNYVRHALKLFLDLLNIFIRILVVLTKKDNKKRK